MPLRGRQPNPQLHYSLPSLPPPTGRPQVQRPPTSEAPSSSTTNRRSPTFLNIRNQEFNEDQFKHSFKNFQQSMIAGECSTCNRKFYDVIIETGNKCKDCVTCESENKPNRFTAANNMDPGDQPNIFKRLTLVEEMLIAQVIKFFKNYIFK
jgi:hypothetical protein